MCISTFASRLAGAALCLLPGPVFADEAHPSGLRADSHAPIGVMRDHTHAKGEWMLSYRFMHMDMGGNRIGTDGATPEEIVTTVPNIFGGPPTLRLVPTDMRMDMHMFGLMYAPAHRLTLMAMGSYVLKEMDHITFQGPAGTTRLGGFTTRSEGFGDVKLSALVSLYRDGRQELHLNAGVSVPTGTIENTDRILTPMNTRPTVRLPYPMQIGSGTFDALPGLSYSGHADRLGWGAQYAGTVRIGENDAGYAYGDAHLLTAWASWLWRPWISSSVRVEGSTRGRVKGRDPAIAGPVQTANPDFQGGERIDLGFGVNLLATEGALRNNRLAVEVVVPVFQDLNGPQLENDWSVTAGWQASF